MFRRKKPANEQVNVTPAAVDVDSQVNALSVAPPASAPKAGPIMPTKTSTPPPRTEITRRPMEIPGSTRRAEPRSPDSDVKKLIVGRDISLSGNITACDRLVVEGTVEANLTEAGAIEIADGGVFRGSAEVDDAEIGGHFEGGLTVRRKLIIRSTGRVQGTVRYGRLVVESGGEIAGTVEVMEGEVKEPRRLTAPQAAPS